MQRFEIYDFVNEDSDFLDADKDFNIPTEKKGRSI